jgi:hypothetical protein
MPRWCQTEEDRNHTPLVMVGNQVMFPRRGPGDIRLGLALFLGKGSEKDLTFETLSWSPLRSSVGCWEKRLRAPGPLHTPSPHSGPFETEKQGADGI